MADTRTAEFFKSIEELKEELKVSDAIFEGVKAANRWKAGRQVRMAEFSSAVQEFLAAPVGAGAADKEAKG